MRKYILYFLLLIQLPVWSQDVRRNIVNSTITKVSLFVQGAQVTREAELTVEQGTWQYMFDKLSPYIDDNSIQIGGTQGVNLMNVFKQMDYINVVEQKRNDHLQDSIDKLNYEIAVCKNRIYADEQEIKLITQNNKVVQDKSNDGVSQLEDLEDYYKKKLPPLYDNILLNKMSIKKLEDQVNKFYKQKRSSGQVNPVGQKQIIAVIKSDTKKKIKISLTYYVNQCGWSPIYDVVFEEINKPLKLIYKASAWQNTLEDWSNVPIRITTGNPNMNGIKPTLYKNSASIAGGVVIQEVSQPMANAALADATVAATSQIIDWSYGDIQQKTDETKEEAIGRIRKNEGEKSEEANDYEGLYDKKEKAAVKNKRRQAEIDEEPDANYEGTAPGVYNNQTTTTYLSAPNSYGASATYLGYATNTPSYYFSSSNLHASYNSNPLRIEFLTEKNYTFKSGEPAQLIALRNYDISPEYKMVTVPKLEKAVFLTAVFEPKEEIAQLTASANIYTAGDFVGTSYLKVNENDTLEVSLGRDKSILVDRKKLKDYSKSSFSGGSKIDESQYEISIRNMKSSTIKIEIEDQIPLSNNGDIKVELLSSDQAVYDETTGKLTWKIELKAGESIKLKFSYKITYPKKPRN